MYSHFPPINLPGLEGKENQTSVKSTNLVLRMQAHFSGSQLSAEVTSGHQELRSSQHEIYQEQPRQTTELKLLTDVRWWKGPGMSQLAKSATKTTGTDLFCEYLIFLSLGWAPCITSTGIQLVCRTGSFWVCVLLLILFLAPVMVHLLLHTANGAQRTVCHSVFGKSVLPPKYQRLGRFNRSHQIPAGT